jgi:hypothetical protein
MWGSKSDDVGEGRPATTISGDKSRRVPFLQSPHARIGDVIEHGEVAAAVQEIDHVDAKLVFNHEIERPRQCVFDRLVRFGGVCALDPVSVFLANILRKPVDKIQEYCKYRFTSANRSSSTSPSSDMSPLPRADAFRPRRRLVVPRAVQP